MDTMKLKHNRDDKGRIYRTWGPFQFGKNQTTGKWIVLNGAGQVLEADSLAGAKRKLWFMLNKTDLRPTVVQPYTGKVEDNRPLRAIYGHERRSTPGYCNMGGGFGPG